MQSHVGLRTMEFRMSDVEIRIEIGVLRVLAFRVLGFRVQSLGFKGAFRV